MPSAENAERRTNGDRKSRACVDTDQARRSQTVGKHGLDHRARNGKPRARRHAGERTGQSNVQKYFFVYAFKKRREVKPRASEEQAAQKGRGAEEDGAHEKQADLNLFFEECLRVFHKPPRIWRWV